VISQDTSAYGVGRQVPAPGSGTGRPVKTHMTDLCEKLAGARCEHGAWCGCTMVIRNPHVDQILR